MEPKTERILWRVSLLSWLVLLAQMVPYLSEIEFTGRVAPFFAGVVYLTYSLVYLLPVLLVLWGGTYLMALKPVDALLRRIGVRPRWVSYAAFVAALSFLQVFVFTDRFIFHLYGFHVNGFVWNLLLTRGGVESLGGSTSSELSFVLIIGGFVLLECVLLVAATRWRRLGQTLDAVLTRRKVIASSVLIVLASLTERFTYGVSSLYEYTPVLVAADAFPFYIPTTFASIAKRLGYEGREGPAVRLKMDSLQARYPLEPIHREPVDRPLNIVWLVAESLRSDALDPVLMPRTFEFSRTANSFKQHYSGGNGTRMAMFSMFYGLYGTYWFSFLHEQRGPVLMDAIIDSGYQTKMFSSAKFTYPEFDKTIFVRVPAEMLHEGEAQPKWRRDRENVDLLLDFIDKRDLSRPFMTFMFFESPHANYYFPRENVVREPYIEDLNYATMDLTRDIKKIKARYDNACNHLDSQYGRIIDYLRQHALLDSTIVLITGDHGEEFMEKGHWGHARGYPEEQVLVPMVLWVPGRPPREVTRMTSHLDVPATLMPLLGVTNSPEDYSLGHDMLGGEGREYTILCDWNTLCYVDGQFKAVFPMSGYGWRDRKVTTKDDRPVSTPAAFYESHRERIVDLMKQLKLFAR